jgi:hypothetical protein
MTSLKHTSEFSTTEAADTGGGAHGKPDPENPRATLLNCVFGPSYDGPVDCRQYNERRTKPNYHALENDRAIGNVFVDHDGMTYCVAIEATVYTEKLINKYRASAVLRMDSKRLVCYRLTTPVPNGDAMLKSITNHVQVSGMNRTISLPMPAIGGWQLANDDQSNSISLDELAEMLADAGQHDGKPKAEAQSGKSSGSTSSKKSSSTPPPNDPPGPTPEQEPSGNAAVQKIRDKIAGLPIKPDKTLVEPIIADIVKLDDDFYTEEFLEELKSKKVKMPLLRRMLASAKRMASGGSLNLKYDEKGRGIFQYHARYNDDDLLELLQIALKQKNTHWRGEGRLKPEPFLTCMLQTPMVMRNRGGVVSFVPLSEGAYNAEVSNNLLMQNVEGSGRREFVPKEICSIAFHTSEQNLPQTPELILTPIFAPDGTLIHKPGRHCNEDGALASHYNIYLAETELKVPEVSLKPSAAEVTKATKLLRGDLLVDFPFLTFNDDGKEMREPGEANALAMLLTPFVRRMIDGCTPLYYIKKPVPGTGGTLLARVAMLISGKEYSSIDIPNNRDELVKTLVSAIMEMRLDMLFDNAKNLNDPFLLQMLTSRKTGGRMLGHNQTIERDNNFRYIATGNNPIILEELHRRICWITMNAKTPNLKKRKFKHKKLDKWVTENRAEIIWALLTLVQSWIANKRPLFTDRTLPSFEEWAEIVGGILKNAGIEGFLDTPERAISDADETNARALVLKWINQHPLVDASAETGAKEAAKSRPVTVSRLAFIAESNELAIWSGKTDDDKRFNFGRKLDAIVERTFDVEFDANGKPTKRVMVQMAVNKDKEIEFCLVEVEIPADE